MKNFTIAIILLSSTAFVQAQPEEGIINAKEIIAEIYKLNTYDHGCYTLKPGIDRKKAEKILAKSDIYNYPLKAREIYDWKKKARSYWEKIFSSLYVEKVAIEYINRCDVQYQSKKNKDTFLEDFRFSKKTEEIASFHVKKVGFEKITGSAKEIHGVAKIELNKGEGFSLHYVLHKTPAGWRMFDIFEMERSADRDNEFFVSNSLQEGLTELKKSR